MDVNTITTLISTVGFPIVCCCGMAYYINSTVKDFQKIIMEHTVAIEKLTTIIDKHVDEK